MVSLPKRLTPHAEMLWHPSAAPMAPGVFGDGGHLMAKLQKSFNLLGSIGTGAGFVLWAPEYHPDISRGYLVEEDAYDAYTQAHRNLFVGYTTNSSIDMTNTSDLPFGALPLTPTQTPGPTGRVATSPDPAGAFLESDLVASARTCAASIKMTYTGALLDMGGQVCSVTGFPAAGLLLGGGNGDTDFTFNIDELFSWSEDHERVQSSTIEVVHEPSASSDVFRDGATAAFAYGLTASGGPSPTPLLLTDTGKAQQPTLMGFAWRGLPTTTTSPMTFDLLKVVEWKPRPISGIVGGTRGGKRHAIIPPVHTARAQLDTHKSGWASRAFKSVEKELVRYGPQIAGYIANAALAEATGGLSLAGQVTSTAVMAL